MKLRTFRQHMPVLVASRFWLPLPPDRREERTVFDAEEEDATRLTHCFECAQVCKLQCPEDPHPSANATSRECDFITGVLWRTVYHVSRQGSSLVPASAPRNLLCTPTDRSVALGQLQDFDTFTKQNRAVPDMWMSGCRALVRCMLSAVATSWCCRQLLVPSSCAHRPNVIGNSCYRCRASSFFTEALVH